eukprot:tig00020964_g16790.t1
MIDACSKGLVDIAEIDKHRDVMYRALARLGDQPSIASRKDPRNLIYRHSLEVLADDFKFLTQLYGGIGELEAARKEEMTCATVTHRFIAYVLERESNDSESMSDAADSARQGIELVDYIHTHDYGSANASDSVNSALESAHVSELRISLRLQLAQILSIQGKEREALSQAREAALVEGAPAALRKQAEDFVLSLETKLGGTDRARGPRKAKK